MNPEALFLVFCLPILSESADGRLVGLYAADSSGILCHMGSRTHVHALIEWDGGLTGHAETVGLAAGAVLKLPVR